MYINLLTPLNLSLYCTRVPLLLLSKADSLSIYQEGGGVSKVKKWFTPHCQYDVTFG